MSSLQITQREACLAVQTPTFPRLLQESNLLSLAPKATRLTTELQPVDVNKTVNSTKITPPTKSIMEPNIRRGVINVEMILYTEKIYECKVTTEYQICSTAITKNSFKLMGNAVHLKTESRFLYRK